MTVKEFSENELLFNKLYEKTKDCGRTQFVNLLMQAERENRELKKQLHEASIEIQCLIEQDIDCPSNCNKLRRLKEKQKEFVEWIEDSIRTLEMLDETFTLKNYKNEIRIYKEILSKYKEIVGDSNEES